MADDDIPVRSARFADAAAIFALIRSHPDELVPRSMSDILQNIDRFHVAEHAGRIVGTASWGILPELGSARHPSVEIKSVAVEASQRGRGVGRRLVEAVIERIRAMNPEQIIVLTFAPEFFRRFGFGEVPKERLMHKLYSGCVNCTRYDSPFTCPEIAMVRTERPAGGEGA
jgi:amino-acid N-acetyltransferase